MKATDQKIPEFFILIASSQSKRMYYILQGQFLCITPQLRNLFMLLMGLMIHGAFHSKKINNADYMK